MINLETALNWFYNCRNRNIYYSWNNPRTGINGHGDCSGVLYQALRNAGASNAGWVLNTDSLHDWLLRNGFELIAKNKEINPIKGDIFILGEKNKSGGKYGHTGMFTGDKENIIHCTAYSNGISIDDFNTMYNRSVKTTPQLSTWYFYRLKQGTSEEQKFSVGSTVTVKNHATHWQTGQAIPSWVKGKTYKVLQVKKVTQSNSKYVYLLQGVNSWILEQDL